MKHPQNSHLVASYDRNISINKKSELMLIRCARVYIPVPVRR